LSPAEPSGPNLPSVIGRQGVIQTLEPDLSKEEHHALHRSAETLRKAVQQMSS
jgi:malate/lactate dehydrogenase